MTTKEKYELIDKSQVSEKLLTILQNMEKSSKNFTDEAVNSRVDSALDKIIEGFKAKKPEALRTITEAKKEVKKEIEKAIKKNEGKDFSDKKDTDNKTGLPQKDTLEERKKIIKKESETEKEARERAKKELEKEKEKAKDEIESQIEKLNRLILEDPALRGFNTGTAATGGGKSTPIIDAERKALPRGSRVSKKGWKNQYGASDGGRKYWENRENRSDRKSPEYETGKPYLEKGGKVYSSDDMYEITMLQDGIELDSKLIRARNKGEARMIFEDMYLDKYQDEFGEFEIKIELAKNKMADGGVVNTRQLNKKIKDWYIKTYPTDDLGKEINDKITFKGFWAYLSQGYDVYNVLEVHDSVVRERIFEKVSEIYGVDYDVIYKKWLRSNNYAQGGGIGFKNFGKTKGRFKLTYEDDGEKQSEIWSSLEEATSSARRYSSHKLGYTNVHIYDETGKEYFFANGGEVEGVDLFEDYDDQPEEVQAILANYDMEDNDYETMQNLKAELESIGYTFDFGLDAEPYDLRKIGQTGKSEFYAKGGMMADGGEVDFSEKLEKMRNSYNLLEMKVKARIASAIGIDDAIRIMGNDYAFHPFDLITSAVRSGLLELDEINRDLVYSALMEAENVTEDYRDSGEGIGSSDMTYFTKSVLDGAGYKTGFINNRLNRVDEDGNELVIDKYEMEF